MRLNVKLWKAAGLRCLVYRMNIIQHELSTVEYYIVGTVMTNIWSHGSEKISSKPVEIITAVLTSFNSLIYYQACSIHETASRSLSRDLLQLTLTAT